MLRKTPYLIEGPKAEGLMESLRDLEDRVSLLRGRGALDEGTLLRLRREWRVEQVYETTGIEGNQLDINETRLVLERGLTITGKPSRDSADVLNMKAALDYLEELASSSQPLSARDLREVQSLVVGDDSGSGAYRTTDVKISGSNHVPPEPVRVAADVDEAFEWLRDAGRCPPPLAAAVMHAWLAQIHPFEDGNGRTARAFMNLVLIRAGYPVVLIRRRDRPRYYDALAAADDGDIAPLVELIVQRAKDSLRQIQRIQTAETGITDAVLRAERQALTQYETWRQAMLLLLRSIQEIAERVESESRGAIEIRVREYDEVTAEDYRALLERDRSGNGWLGVIRGRGITGVRSELLLWVGYRSVAFRQCLGDEAEGPSVFISEPDPTGKHPFRQVTDPGRMPVEEIAFDGGSYLVLERGQLRRVLANELSAEIVKAFLGVYLSEPVPAVGTAAAE